MRIVTAHLKSLSAYHQSRPYNVEPLEGESKDEYEKRTWRNRCHVTKDGNIFIPPMAFKEAIAEAAKYSGDKIAGKRNATWTKHFVAGVMVQEGPVLPIKAAEVDGTWLYLNADGKKGGGTRVWRCMPTIPEWEATVTYYVIDDIITKDAFEKHLELSGKLIGIGQFRPQKGGYAGRFSVEGVEWK